MRELKNQLFEKGNDIVRYFEMQDSNSFLRMLYENMKSSSDEFEKDSLQKELRNRIVAGSIDVNIMTKCDRTNYAEDGSELPQMYSDALSALRGYANSKVNSSVVFSAGLNPRLYSYCESFDCFYPDEKGELAKKIVIKVSDYRSALIQGKFLAKKGLWVSEFRIESGLNCGGHAFPTEGILLGPILEEFKNKKTEMRHELMEICNAALKLKNRLPFQSEPSLKVTVQGGIGTANEDRFIREYYKVDSTGWGSPFLMVPEATNVDAETLASLIEARPEDYYTSYASPLGIAFNNFKKSSSEQQRKRRIQKDRPGSPCYKKYLAFNTEFTDKPICTASRQYQDLKIKQLKSSTLSSEALNRAIDKVMEKDCLCEGLGVSALLKNHAEKPKQLKAVAICPGPNLAFFSGSFTLEEMVAHIYGKINILNSVPRPHMFINEIKLYYNFLISSLEESETNAARIKYLDSFKNNLLEGINYYFGIFQLMTREQEAQRLNNLELLKAFRNSILLLFNTEQAKVA